MPLCYGPTVMPERTRRQQLIELLTDFEATFDELRRELGVPVHVLQEDLKHVVKSARHVEGLRGELEVTPARCLACGFEMTRNRRFTAPSRCPKCKSERFEAPRLHLR